MYGPVRDAHNHSSPHSSQCPETVEADEALDLHSLLVKPKDGCRSRRRVSSPGSAAGPLHLLWVPEGAVGCLGGGGGGQPLLCISSGAWDRPHVQTSARQWVPTLPGPGRGGGTMGGPTL